VGRRVWRCPSARHEDPQARRHVTAAHRDPSADRRIRIGTSAAGTGESGEAAGQSMSNRPKPGDTRYQERLDEDLCVRCGERAPEDGCTACRECLDGVNRRRVGRVGIPGPYRGVFFVCCQAAGFHRGDCRERGRTTT